MNKRGVAFLAAIFTPAILTALLAGLGWLVLKVIIGVSIAKAINPVTLTIIGIIFVWFFFRRL